MGYRYLVGHRARVSIDQDSGIQAEVTMTTKDEILEQRIIIRKRKKVRPKGWHQVLRQKRKAGRRARGVTLGQRRK